MRAIAGLHVGDLVQAEDPRTGKVEAEPVQGVIVRRVTPLLAVDLSDGSSIRVTDNHRFWVDGGPGLGGPGWVLSGLLKPGDRLRTADGKDVTVLRVRWNQGEAVVYTLTVANDHTFFVGSARVLVHNANPVDELVCEGTGGPSVRVVYYGTISRPGVDVANSDLRSQMGLLSRAAETIFIGGSVKAPKVANEVLTVATAREGNTLYVAFNAGFYSTRRGYSLFGADLESAANDVANKLGLQLEIVPRDDVASILQTDRSGIYDDTHAEVVLHRYLTRKGLLGRVEVLGSSRTPCSVCRANYFNNLSPQEQVLISYPN